jgi:hypothetical protein
MITEFHLMLRLRMRAAIPLPYICTMQCLNKPKMGRLDDVEGGTQILKRWRLKAQDRKEWTVILREAMAKLKCYKARGRRKRRLSKHRKNFLFRRKIEKGTITRKNRYTESEWVKTST